MKEWIKRHTVAAACIVLAGMISAADVSAETYEYDELSRVSKVIYDDGSYQTYTYDANGNIKEIASYDASGKKLPQNSGGASGSGGNQSPGGSPESGGNQSPGGSPGSGGSQGSGGGSGSGGSQDPGGNSGSGGNQEPGSGSGSGEGQGSGKGWQDAADGISALHKKINTLAKIAPAWVRDSLRIIRKGIFFLKK